MAAPRFMTSELEIVAEFNTKRAFLSAHIAESALCEETALMSLSGSKEGHFNAAARHSLPMLRALNALHGAYTDLMPMHNAAEEGNLECMQYLHALGFPWDVDTAWRAAYKGHILCLQFMHERGCPLDYRTVFWAAVRGHIACLRYAHENGCRWRKNDDRNSYDPLTVLTAQAGHVDCLRYAAEHGCPWHPKTAAYAKNDPACKAYCAERAAVVAAERAAVVAASTA
jgi:hypothetical protein